MKRWGAGSEAASESVVSRKDRRKENTGGVGAPEGEEGRRGSTELGGASEHGHRPLGGGRPAAEATEAWPGAAQRPQGGASRGDVRGSSRRKRQEQAQGGHCRAGAGRSRQVEMVCPAPPSVTARNLSRPQSPSAPSASRPLSCSWEPEEQVMLSVLAFSASCAPVVGTPECCSGDRRALTCRSHGMLRTGPHEELVLCLHCFYPVLMRQVPSPLFI